jgi:outer membrane protein assembly factor BamE
MLRSCVRVFVSAVVLTLAGGCQTLSNVGSSMSGWAPTFLAPYRPDVHQGNIITQEMVEQLRLGMTRDQVRFMLGTPLLTSEFHKDRWEYAYYLNPRRGEVQNRRLTVTFKDNRLDRFVADPMPPEALADTLILGPNARRKPKEPPRQPEKPPEIQTPPPGRES